MADAMLVQRAKNLLERLAQQPRFAGSAGESRARAICREELSRAGFSCRDLSFEFSEWPARWGPPIADTLQLGMVLAMIALAARGNALDGLILAAAMTLGLAMVARRARQRGVLSFRYGRSRSANLEAVRGRPRVWLVAHLDSKSQTVPMLVRIAGTIALQAISVITVVMVLSSAAGFTHSAGPWAALGIAAVVAAIPVAICFVGDESPGAVDNATGVVAVILAAQASEPDSLGVLITSGEELGLAGARAWTQSASKGICVVNCDTIDDAGGWRCMYTGTLPGSISSATRIAAGGLGMSMRMSRLIPGILADSIAFADAGMEAITLSRGTLSTLARIHTRRDTSNGLTGRGAADASVFLSALAKELS